MALLAFMRTCEKDTFRRVAVAVTDRFAVDATLELSVLGSGLLWLLSVVRRTSLVFLVGRMCWPTLTANIWDVGTVTSW